MKNMVSVIIPFYNRSTTIKRALDSIFLEGNIDHVGEIIVIDDGSDLEENNKLKEIVSNFNTLNSVELCQVISYPDNKNAAYARNVGILASKFSIVAFLDSDDEWVQGKLAQQIALLKDDSIVFTQYLKKSLHSNNRINLYPKSYNNENVSRYLLKYDGHIQTSTMLMQKKVAERILFNPRLKKYQDWDFAIRAYANKITFIFIQEPLVNYYVDSNDRIGSKVSMDLVEDFIISIDDHASKDAKLMFVASSKVWNLIYNKKYLESLRLLFKPKTLKAIGVKRAVSIIIFLNKYCLRRMLGR